MPEILEDQIVLYVDLLGFSETTAQSNPELQSLVLSLLTNIAALKSEFASSTQKTENGTTHNIRPSISTFSDHIVASYSPSRIDADDDIAKPFVIMRHLRQLIPSIAVAALGLGFLMRGGLAFGKLYHSGGVVFGPALIEAVSLESRTAVYPRIVLSEQAAQFFGRYAFWLARDFDGVSYVDFYRDCITRGTRPGDDYPKQLQQWLAQYPR